MRIIMLVFGLLLIGSVQVGLPTEALAQVGSSISTDGSPPNDNAMLDVKSPMSGAGKGILIPRVTENQRTNASLSVDGGLLDNSGNLRGGAAQGLMVYQTDPAEGLYFNASQTATPAWVYLGISTTNYLPLTGGTMSGALNMGGQIVSNVASIDFNGNNVSVGRGANGSSGGAAMGYLANAYFFGTVVGREADGSSAGAALGYTANGSVTGVAVGVAANGNNQGVAVGYQANGSVNGVAVGWGANGVSNGAAVGYQAYGNSQGAAVGRAANGSAYGAAVGRQANGYWFGAAVGESANGSIGAAMGYLANGYDSGAALGERARGTNYGAAVGAYAYAHNYGAGLGYYASGYNQGVGVGAYANGAQTNVAIGIYANANGSAQGTNRIAIGNYVTNTNTVNNTAVIRGTLWLDGGTGVMTRASFGSGNWTPKAFEIDHPLDPENKILRHFCLEGPQVWNVYAGNAQLKNGQAMIELPDYYSALNLVGSEIYSLTPIGGRADIWIQEEVSDNCFLIQGETDLKVSWTIKVLRNDPGCREGLRRRPVEQWKSEIGNWKLETGN